MSVKAVRQDIMKFIVTLDIEIDIEQEADAVDAVYPLIWHPHGDAPELLKSGDDRRERGSDKSVVYLRDGRLSLSPSDGLAIGWLAFPSCVDQEAAGFDPRCAVDRLNALLDRDLWQVTVRFPGGDTLSKHHIIGREAVIDVLRDMTYQEVGSEVARLWERG